MANMTATHWTVLMPDTLQWANLCTASELPIFNHFCALLCYPIRVCKLTGIVPNVANTPTGWAILPLSILLGNTLILVVCLHDVKLRSTSLNKFIASRAVSDLLLAVVVLPVAVYVKVCFGVCVWVISYYQFTDEQQHVAFGRDVVSSAFVHICFHVYRQHCAYGGYQF
jgi:hypothetical protein